MQLKASQLANTLIPSFSIIAFVLLLQGCAGLGYIFLFSSCGYFLGDFTVAYAHFLIDNFKPDDQGYQHHLRVKKLGFNIIEGLKESRASPVELCAPGGGGCMPCSPCAPRDKESIALCSPGMGGCRPCSPCAPKTNSIDSESTMLCAPGGCMPQCEPCIPTSGKTLCAPGGCMPNCKPCVPKTGKLSFIGGNAVSVALYVLGITWQLTMEISLVRSVLIAVSPVFIFMFYPPMMACGLVLIVTDFLNMVSGTGMPDFYAHHPEKAPFLVRVAQKSGLMMDKSMHKDHHRNPRGGYAYFSPITNLVLDNTGFWSAMTTFEEYRTGVKSQPVPVALDLY